MTLNRYRYIVVEGPIGAGKTTLARRLVDSLQAQALLELPEENPFLEKFYREPSRYALQTQMFFLFQRMAQLRGLAQTDLFTTRVVSDFLLEKDPIFARITLSDDEFKLYQQMYDHVRPQASPPDLVIYLQAQPDTLVERIRKRGTPMESGIAEPYLMRLCESYNQFFYHYDAAPLLTVNTEHLNPVARDEDFQLLLKHIENMRGKREYFNLGE